MAPTWFTLVLMYLGIAMAVIYPVVSIAATAWFKVKLGYELEFMRRQIEMAQLTFKQKEEERNGNED